MVREPVVDWSGAVGKPLYHADQTVADRLEGPVAMQALSVFTEFRPLWLQPKDNGTEHRANPSIRQQPLPSLLIK